MPADRLYYLNSYIKDFTANVVAAKRLPSGNYEITLDRTAFYPESGGQPADTGFIQGIPVIDVQEENGEILHILTGCPSQSEVACSINWQRRFDHMQQHSGEHVLTGAFGQVLGASNIGFHLGQDSSQIDVNIDSLSPEEAAAVEAAANNVVFENRPVSIHIAESASLSNFKLRKQPTKEYETLRLIDVAAFDCCPCGGTHVAMTGEIGLIKIRGWERKKNSLRIDFVCGNRALLDYQLKNDIVKELSTRLSVPSPELIGAHEKQTLRLEALTKELSAVQKERTLRLAHDLYVNSKSAASVKIITHVLTGSTPSAASDLAREIAGMENAVALIASQSTDLGKTHLVFAANPSLKVNMNNALKLALPYIEGKGGGSPFLAQGGGTNPGGLEQALAAAKKSIIV